MKLRGVAAAWLRREDWPKWCEIDPDFQRDFDVWLAKMEKAVAGYQAAGVPIVKTLILPDEFIEWSRVNNAGIGTGARAAFAAVKSMQLDNREEKR